MVESLKYWVWLSSLFKVGPRKCNQLLEHFGDPVNIWHASKEELTKLPFLTPVNLNQLLDGKVRKETASHMDEIHRNNINMITIRDELYPWYLKNTYDPPAVLYVKGRLLKDERIVAVVGSRKASPYGLSMSERISFELAGYGITVASGMARGIDSYAHSGALEGGGRTIAIEGCGLDMVYPSENKELMERIICSGAVISEYVPGIPPIPQNFPARNRIISGISVGVVIIEAGERSGSLITAGYALDQGREVFAVPGNINSVNSKGTNRLIKDGAKIVTCIEDIMEELIVLPSGTREPVRHGNGSGNRLLIGLEDDERTVAECLAEQALHIDVIARRCGLPVKNVNSVLVMMELKGIIEQLPGKLFRLRE